MIHRSRKSLSISTTTCRDDEENQEKKNRNETASLVERKEQTDEKRNDGMRKHDKTRRMLRGLLVFFTKISAEKTHIGELDFVETPKPAPEGSFIRIFKSKVIIERYMTCRGKNGKPSG